MINLLRMDLYRLRKSKSVYICLAVLFGLTILSLWLTFLVATPEGQQTSLKLGMTALSEVNNTDEVLDGANSLIIFRENCMDGGLYSVIFGIVVALLICGDFNHGFAKNIMSCHRHRWKYIGSKLMAVGIVNLIYIALCLLLSTLMNFLLHNMVPYAVWTDTLFYLAWAWLLNMALAAIIILICVFTRSTAVGVLMAVLIGGGLIAAPLYSLSALFHLEGWAKYSIYFNLSYGPSCFSSVGDLKVFAVGLALMAVYSLAAAISLSKKDI